MLPGGLLRREKMIENGIALTLLVFAFICAIWSSFGWHKESKKRKQSEEEKKFYYKEYSKKKSLAEFYENELIKIKDGGKH